MGKDAIYPISRRQSGGSNKLKFKEDSHSPRRLQPSGSVAANRFLRATLINVMSPHEEARLATVRFISSPLAPQFTFEFIKGEHQGGDQLTSLTCALHRSNCGAGSAVK